MTEDEWRKVVDANYGHDPEFRAWAYTMVKRTENDLALAYLAWCGKAAANSTDREVLDVLSMTVPASASKHPALVAERRRRRL